MRDMTRQAIRCLLCVLTLGTHKQSCSCLSSACQMLHNQKKKLLGGDNKHALDRSSPIGQSLRSLSKEVIFFYVCEEVIFRNCIQSSYVLKAIQTAVGNYLPASSFYVTRQYVHSFLKQGNFRPKHVKASGFNRKLCSKHGPLYLWQISQSKQ